MLLTNVLMVYRSSAQVVLHGWMSETAADQEMDSRRESQIGSPLKNNGTHVWFKAGPRTDYRDGLGDYNGSSEGQE